MGVLFRQIYELVLHFFLPNICFLCSKTISDGEICKQCSQKFHTPVEPLCQLCGGSCDNVLSVCRHCLTEERLWVCGISGWSYKEGIQEAVHQYKYYETLHWQRFFIPKLVDACRERDLQPDLVTWIPLHWSKWGLRGYNQSQIIARSLASSLILPCKKTLVRVKLTRQQAGLKRSRRIKNMKNAFKIYNTGLDDVNNMHVLLVDDVLTTGATLNCAVKVLLKAGASKVSVITIARG